MKMDRGRHTATVPPYVQAWFNEIKIKISDACPQYFDIVLEYLAHHPYVAISLLAIAVTCIIPVLVFLLFAGLSIFVTFFLFFAAEGTLIIIGLGVLVGVIVILCTVLIIGLVTATITWYFCSQFLEYLSTSYDVPVHSRASSPVPTDTSNFFS